MFDNVKIPVKMLLMVIVPIIGILIFAAQDISVKLTTLHSLQTTRILTAFAIKSGSLIHQLQKERGLTTGFISSKGDKFRTELSKQRVDTDSQIRELKFYSSSNKNNLELVRERLDAAGSLLEKLAMIRADVDSMKLEPKDSLAYYTRTISSYLDVVAQITIMSMNPELTREAMAYHAFLSVKEQAGLERATLSGVFATNRFDNKTYEDYVGIAAAQATFLDVFNKFADTYHQKAYLEKMNAPFYQQVEEMRSIALARRLTGDFGIRPENWFTTSTAMINAMKEMEDMLATHMAEKSDRLASAARLSLALSVFTAACSSAVTLLFGFIVMIGINAPLKTMAIVLKDMADGKKDLTRRLDIDRKDEVGEVCRWFNRLMDSLESLLPQGEGGRRPDEGATVPHKSSSAPSP
ncbi:MAG: HAMP domain-containing protein [Geobacter sp.]|nr:HAMP domain-containing protein [Geobacter sp.]